MATNMTLMTFNLRTSRAPDGDNAWMYRFEQAAEMIREHDPLLFGTQEGHVGMLEDLRLTDYQWVGEGRLGEDKDELSAIFFKPGLTDMVEHGTFWLSEQPEVPASVSWDSSLPRICTWAHVRHKATGAELLYFNTHLDHRGQLAREQGVRLIWSRIKEMRAARRLPVVLTGDFNAEPDNAAIRFMRGQLAGKEEPVEMTDAYAAVKGPIGATFHNNYCGREEGQPIDYIFVTPDVRVESVLIDRRKIGGRYPSDHYPVVAQLVIPAAPLWKEQEA
ncbi:Endonuclease/Exonuclease/phosphatase family protein [Paenibacillus konkukensis]|uniref:Endonuclease/Exonuclease/phosphatase family protein n=1 Tax=Paenibacillus konkukensis TaxID=2020716 RepID=A0ABY4RQ60_9BACL|nr:endonuclease/exonuclease/phosphatase family protein [Paenibacillus konkukensis]UQZ84651.1 Endonuclease/Exonuclease/phosphatase family protein [Paenibacillus konkukensis]